MNVRSGLIAAGVVVAIAVIILGASVYTVGMTEYVVITRFGEPVPGSEKIGPGFHFKTPFIETVNRIEKRLLSWDGDPSRMSTKDKKLLRVDTFARWKIAKPLAFYLSVGVRVEDGQKKLDDIIDSAVRNVVSKHFLIDVVRTSSRQLIYEESAELAAEQLERGDEVSVGRAELVARILKTAKELLDESLGIEIIDVRIKRVNYVKGKVRDSVYARMRSERALIAAKYLSEAREQANEILGEMNKELALIRGEAEETAATTRGQADAAAIKIYGDAIATTKDFFEFLRALEAYKACIDERTTLVLSTESDFLRFLKRFKEEE